MQVTYRDGDRASGAVLTRPGLVRIVHENGDVFEGFIVQSNAAGDYVPHGRGKYTWTTSKRMSVRYKCYYEGEYDHGERHGLGEYYYPNGSVYRGSWHRGHKHGAGSITYTNADRFSGWFLDDQKHGKGSYVYAQGGAKLVGEWSHGSVLQAKWVFPTGSAMPSPAPNPAAGGDSGKVFGVVIAGAPASGKGTQCERIRDEFGLVHLSTGDMLRAAVAAQTPVGVAAGEVMQRGGLVSDELVIGAIRERLAQPDVREHGFLLDGFPRTPNQALALKQLGVLVSAFIMLNVPDELILERVTGRRVDPVTGNSYHVKFNPAVDAEVADRLIQRKDDTEECVKQRLEAYHGNIASVRTHFESCEVSVDGTGKPAQVWQQIEVSLQQLLLVHVAAE